ncbi:MAG: zeta toxin family protein [Oscillospiraceae bacterium]|nr:zeta toxin family protein [Oscillospiraceae bacterium]
MTDYSAYSESDFREAFDKFYRLLTDGKRPVNNPKAFLLGGQSGAGKTTIHDIIQKANTNFIVIDGDRFRERHPNFEEIHKIYGNNAANYTQKFSNSIVNALIERLSSERFNLIIEGTCRTAEVPLNTCRYLKNKGYSVKLAVMCTDKETSWQSTIDRYNEMERLGLLPRAVPRDKFEETVKAIPDNISALYKSGEFDNILLFNRKTECLYNMKKQPQQNPAEIVKRELNGKQIQYQNKPKHRR